MDKPSCWSYIQQSIHRPIVAALLALLIYGVWAGCVNIDHGNVAALRAGLGQGVYAFFATLLVSVFALNIYRRFNRTAVAMLLAFSLSFLLMLIIPLSVHTYLQTPDRWQAMSLGLVWGTGYLIWVLWMERRIFMATSSTSSV